MKQTSSQINDLLCKLNKEVSFTKTFFFQGSLKVKFCFSVSDRIEHSGDSTYTILVTESQTGSSGFEKTIYNELFQKVYCGMQTLDPDISSLSAICKSLKNKQHDDKENNHG